MNAREQAAWEVHLFLYRQRQALDATYVRHWLQAFADLLENPEIRERFEKPWKRIQAA